MNIYNVHKSRFIIYSISLAVCIGILIYVFISVHSFILPLTKKISNGTHYTNQQFHFSFIYPDNLKLNSFTNPGGGEVVLIRASTTSEKGIQIIMQPFNEPQTTSITVDRIHHDVPEMTVVKSNEVTIDDIGKGIMFYDGTSVSAKEQIWFVAKDILYQVTVTPTYVNTAKQIIDSWKFE